MFKNKEVLAMTYYLNRFLIFLFLFAAYHSIANGAQFLNQYLQFELPPGWECNIEGTEYVCQSTNKDRQKEAIIILAAKLRGKQDTYDSYKAYLSAPKQFKLPGGKFQKSEPMFSKMRDISGHRWVDAMHMASEVPGFYTRYLATVKEDLGVAVTFSVSKDHYKAYKDIFDSLITTLRVFRQSKKGSFSQQIAKDGSTKRFSEDGITILPGDDQMDVSRKQQGGAGMFGTGENDVMILAVVAAVTAFFILKKLKKK